MAQLPWQRCTLGGQNPWLLTPSRLPGLLLKTIILQNSCHCSIPCPWPSLAHFLRCQVVHWLFFSWCCWFSLLCKCNSTCSVWVFVVAVCYCHQVVLWLLCTYRDLDPRWCMCRLGRQQEHLHTKTCKCCLQPETDPEHKRSCLRGSCREF